MDRPKMGRGRPPKPGTTEEKAAARRERVRNNVRALRERRRKEAALVGGDANGSCLAVEWVGEHVTNEPLAVKRASISPDGLEFREDSEGSDVSSNTKILRPGAFYLVNRRNDTRVIFPTTVDMKSPYAMALLATVREQFLPDSVYLPPAINSTDGKPWESEQFLWTPCAFWVTSAFAKASNQETSLLKTSLLSIGMLMKSLQFQDTSLRVASLEMYRRCLQGIRKSLEPLVGDQPKIPNDSVALYLSCHAAAMFELVQNSDLSAAMQHLRGVSQLICHLSGNKDEEGQSIAWLLLQDYRFAEMGLCLKFRYASVTSLRRRQYENVAFEKLKLSGRDASAFGYGSHNMLVRITDMADDISAIMVQLDNLQLHRNRADTFIKLRRMLEKLETIWTGYQYLQDQLISRYGSAFVYIDASDEGPASGSYKFKTFDIGAAWCYNLMTQIYCIETKIEATTMALDISSDLDFYQPPKEGDHTPESDDTDTESVDDFVSHERLQELRHSHRTICIQLTQCIQYFLQTDKGITGQALAIFPLDVAIFMLEHELQRLQNDLRAARIPQRSAMQVQQEIIKLVDARAFCQKMQDRAKALGLPAFYAAGSENTGDSPSLETLKEAARKG